MSDCEYQYHHGTGRHILVKRDKDDDDYNQPKYSFHCLLCYCCDALVLLLIIGFLGGAAYLCYYLYNNYSGDN